MDISKRQKETQKAFKNPRTNDAFHEMFSFWVVVLKRYKDSVLFSEGGSANPLEHTVSFASLDDFKEKFKYDKSGNKYWVDYAGKCKKRADIMRGAYGI